MHDSPETESQSETRPLKSQLHGVLVRVFDVGVLLLGESGIGKSECALDLITKGHRLVADDAVEIVNRDGKLIGRAPELTKHLLEIRGLGIINIRDIFGAQAVCEESEVDVSVDLRKKVQTDRLASAISSSTICGVGVPRFVLPVSTGRNLATLVETAVRIFRSGDSDVAAEQLAERHARLLDPVR